MFSRLDRLRGRRIRRGCHLPAGIGQGRIVRTAWVVRCRRSVAVWRSRNKAAVRRLRGIHRIAWHCGNRRGRAASAVWHYRIQRLAGCRRRYSRLNNCRCWTWRQAAENGVIHPPATQRFTTSRSAYCYQDSGPDQTSSRGHHFVLLHEVGCLRLVGPTSPECKSQHVTLTAFPFSS
ncbi:hypothetical protein HRbin36_02872 [bacterium HR36]|nr:hypothetical protein HRbin36_02872 [bacterium HR36]